jgi:NADH:ubiquinone reductase (H+-translocating)
VPFRNRSQDRRKRLLPRTNIRRAVIGLTSGVISSVALVTTLHSFFLGIALGAVVGVLYVLPVRPTRFAYAEGIFTAGSLAIPLWAVVSIIVLPAFAGNGPQWAASGMRALFPQFVGWVLFGASLGLIAQLLSDLSFQLLGPEPATQAVEFVKTRIVVLGGGFAGMTTAECLEREFGSDRSVSFTLISEGNALLFTPMMAEVAGSSLEPSHISSPLRTSLRRTDVVRTRVTGVDFEKRQVLIDYGTGGDPEVTPYDHLVFAIGSVSNYFGNTNIRNSSFDFKTLTDAKRT